MTKAIKRNKAELHCTFVYPYWSLEMPASMIKAEYPHLTVFASISPACIRLLRIELDYYPCSTIKLMNKMIGMTGHGIVLCSKENRVDKLISAYHVAVKEGKVVTDGIFIGLLKDFLDGGLLGTTFGTMDGSMFQFLPN